MHATSYRTERITLHEWKPKQGAHYRGLRNILYALIIVYLAFTGIRTQKRTHTRTHTQTSPTYTSSCAHSRDCAKFRCFIMWQLQGYYTCDQLILRKIIILCHHSSLYSSGFTGLCISKRTVRLISIEI